MTQAQLKMIQSAMRSAQKRGVNPYDSQPSQAKSYSFLAKMNQGRNTVTRSEADANRYMGVR
jgi:hypothetical protein